MAAEVALPACTCVCVYVRVCVCACQVVWTITDAQFTLGTQDIEHSLLLCLPCFSNPLALVLALKQTFDNAGEDSRAVRSEGRYFKRQEKVGNPNPNPYLNPKSQTLKAKP